MAKQNRLLATIFNSADFAVITKMDLAAAVEFNEAAALANIQAVRPGMQVFNVSAKTGTGMVEYCRFLSYWRFRDAGSNGIGNRMRISCARIDLYKRTCQRHPLWTPR